MSRSAAFRNPSEIQPRALIVYLALALLVLIAAGPAPAHLRLTKSAPENESVLEAAPDAIRLWFSLSPELAVSRIALTGPDGTVALGDPRAGDENSLAADVQGTMPAGEYTVSWRASSGDGHPIRGTFTFAVAAR